MADDPTAGPSPEDATRVRGGKPDDATVVKPDTEATVIAARGSPAGTGGQGDGAHRPVPDDGASAAAGEDELTVMSSADAQGATPAGSGSTAARTAAGSAAADDLTVARSQGGAAGAGGSQQSAADARTEAVPWSRGAAGTAGNTYTLGSATVASGGASTTTAPPVARAVLLGIVTGLALFAVTALWLLRGH